MKNNPLSKAGNVFKKMLQSLKNGRAKRKAGARLIKLAQQRIDQGVDAFGKPFIKNSPVTIKRKGRNKPLFDTGRMYRGYRYSIMADSIIITNKQKYAINHQFGIGVAPRVVLTAKDGATILQEELQRLAAQK